MLEVRLEHGFSSKSGGFNLSVNFKADCQCLALFGPSGSGKTLTLNALAGLFKPQKGYIKLEEKVLYNSKDKVCLPARNRKIGYVFQDYALFPHLTVRENVAFPFKKAKRARPDFDEKIDSILKSFELESLAKSYPSHISGGQKQRTALARALAFEPSLLLMDEPFSALDSLLRSRVRAECAELLSGLSIPTIIITHDPVDVLAFADEVVFYDRGKASKPADIEELVNSREENSLVKSLAEIAKYQPGLRAV